MRRQFGKADILVAVAALAVVVGGVAWFLLGGGDGEVGRTAPAQPVNETAATSQSPIMAAGNGESSASLLNKARLAVSAGLITEPPGQNALYYYSLLREADPDNAEANSELTAVVETVEGEISRLVAKWNFAAAASIADRLAIVMPESEAVSEFWTRVEGRRWQLINRAKAAAESGDEPLTAKSIATARQLPGTDAAGVLQAAVRDIENVTAARLSAEAESAAAAAAEEALAAEALADGEPEVDPAATAFAQNVAAIRDRIASGKLAIPKNDSALALLEDAMKATPGAPELVTVKNLLVAALEARSQRQIVFEQLDEAEANIAALAGLGGANRSVAELESALNEALITREGKTVIAANTLEFVKVVQPVYPRKAKRRGKEGWVSVEFTVNREGRTVDIEVIDTNDAGVFEQATAQAVSQWLFEPRIFRGQAIDQRVAARVVFKMDQS